MANGDLDLRGHWERLAHGQARCPSCSACGRALWPPRSACPRCGSADLVWIAFPPTGRLFTWTVVGRTTLPEFSGRTPYGVGVIELPELAVRVVGFLDHPPDELEVGMPLAWKVVANDQGEPRVQWASAKSDRRDA